MQRFSVLSVLTNVILVSFSYLHRWSSGRWALMRRGSLMLHMMRWGALVLRKMVRWAMRRPVRPMGPVLPTGGPTQLVVRRTARHHHARPVGTRPVWTAAEEVYAQLLFISYKSIDNFDCAFIS